MQKAQDTARKKGGVTGTVAASLPLTLRQSGMETRCPEGAGQRQRSWLGAKHDSPGSRQGSRPASAKTDRLISNRNNRRVYTMRSTHWHDKKDSGI
ncbi:hypothetical protein D0C99_20320 [Salmonella enterica]|nr:hypothetical protein [Salmonella enterica]